MGLLVHIQLQTTEKLRIFIEDEKAFKFFLTKRKVKLFKSRNIENR